MKNGRMGPSIFRLYTNGPLVLSDPGMKFEESSHLVPQLSEVVTFGPFKESFGDMAVETPHHS